MGKCVKGSKRRTAKEVLVSESLGLWVSSLSLSVLTALMMGSLSTSHEMKVKHEESLRIK